MFSEYPFRDLVHGLIEKDDWTITDLGFTQAGNADFSIGSWEDSVLEAEKAGQKIAVQMQYSRGSQITHTIFLKM